MKESFKENLKPVIFIVIVLVLTAISASPQRKFGGRVVEVIDGKTCVIELPGGKLTAVLQYIEIPDPEQPLSQTVKEHLQQLVLDKKVEFMPRAVMKNRTFVRLFVKGVDVGQQMLRDGAAWYSITEKESQDEDESLLYEDNEKQAKAEKRGVWGVPNLKPVWEFRAEQAALRKKQEQEAFTRAAFLGEMQSQRRQQQQKPATRQVKQLDSESSLWSQTEERQMPQGVTNIGGLMVSHDPYGRFGFVATPLLKLEILGNNNAPAVSIGIGYFYTNAGAEGTKQTYLVGVESQSKDFSFLKNNNLVVTAGKQKISVGKAKRVARENDFGVKEFLIYEIKRDVIEKISNAENVRVKVGIYDAKVNADIQKLLKNMLQATE
jgi:endonuclease YncB( thermonuclease family)